MTVISIETLSPVDMILFTHSFIIWLIYDRYNWWNYSLCFEPKQSSRILSQKLGFEVKSDMKFGNNLRWIEVAPKESKSTISLVEPNVELLKTDEEINRAKMKIGTDTDIWFYSNDIESTYDMLKDKGVELTRPEKQDWGGSMSVIVDQDRNKFGIISAPPS